MDIEIFLTINIIVMSGAILVGVIDNMKARSTLNRAMQQLEEWHLEKLDRDEMGEGYTGHNVSPIKSLKERPFRVLCHPIDK